MTTSNSNSSNNRQAEMFAGSTAMMAEPGRASDAQNPSIPYQGSSGGDDTTGSTGGQPGGNSGSGGDPSQPGAMGGGDVGDNGGGGTGGSGGGMTGSPGGGTGTAGGDGGTGSSGGGGGTTAGGDGGTGSSGGGGTTTAGGDGGTGSSGGGGGTGTTGGDGGVHLPGLGDLPVVGDLGGLLNPVAGANAPLQPVFGAVNTLANDVNQELGTLGHELGLGQLTDAATGLINTVGLGDIGGAPAADGHTNLVTDVLNAPGSILDGGLMDSVSHIGADLSDTINAVSSLKDSAIFGSDPTNPVSDLISGLGHDLQNTPLLTLNGGNNANDGGLLGGAVGSLNGSSSGHLVDVDAGPQQDHGLLLNLLSPADSSPQHTVDVHAVDVGPTGPQLLDLGLLTGGNGVLSGGDGLLSGVTGALSGEESPLSGVTGLLSGGNGALSGATGLLSDLHIPTLGGAGADGLAGNLLGGSSVLSGNSTSAPVTAPVNVDAGHDLGSLITDHGVLDLHGTHII